jgi:hypothetical protein
MDASSPLAHAGRLRRWWVRRPPACIVVALVALLALFYGEENWRGKRAWVQAKRALEAKGASLDWSAYVPRPIPDEQNIFKAPKMAEWFAGRGPSELARRFGTLPEYATTVGTDLLAEVIVLAPGAGTNAQPSDLTLRYRYSALAVASAAEAGSTPTGPVSAPIPLIVMDDVPLTCAIRTLAREAGLKYLIDPRVGFIEGGPQPSVSARWENLTAHEVLVAMLGNYNLQLIENPQTGIAHVVVKQPPGTKVRVVPAAREQIISLVAQALARNGAPFPKSLTGSQGLTLLARPLTATRPLRLTVRSETMPNAEEISAFFPSDFLGPAAGASSHLRAEAAGTNSFHVFLGPPLYYTAAEYLAWSDQFGADFDLMREALKRRLARLEGDYLQPLSMPNPNFVMVRTTTQTLAQRAQCLLLLGRPDQALRELTLIHQLCRLTQPAPGGGPVTVVAAMVDVAVTGLYVDAIADGLRLGVWREPELAALQQQLREIDLPPILRAALQTEQASLCHAFESLGPSKVLRSCLFTFGSPLEPTLLERLNDSRNALLALAPRGWTFQNMALAARLEQESVDLCEPGRQTISPRKVDALDDELQRAFGHVSAKNLMAAIIVPNVTRLWQLLVRNQTHASQALIACALERHRLARGDYPATLDALVPQFADALPRDPLNGQPFKYCRGAGGAFLLYSSGWNEKDAGETFGPGPGENASIPPSNWAWR